MPYRRIDITLPADDETDLRELCDSVNAIDIRSWRAGDDGRRCWEVLVRDDAAEPVLEKLSEKFHGHEDFRAEVLELAALRPRPEEEEDGEEKNGDDHDDSNHRARNRISRDELLDDLQPGAQVSRVYLITVLLSTVIASVGLVRNNAAVVIGAMVIAPLLLPNMSLALGTTLADWKMIRNSLLTNAAGVGLCLVFSYGVGFFVPFDPQVEEIAMRTSTGYSDIALALAAGTAGAVAVTSGVSANLIGVMVAVALLPPMVVLGLLMGGSQWDLAVGAGLLAGVNLACVNLAAVGTFLIRGIRPGRFYEQAEAKKTAGGALVVWVLAIAVAVLFIWLADQENEDQQEKQQGQQQQEHASPAEDSSPDGESSTSPEKRGL